VAPATPRACARGALHGPALNARDGFGRQRPWAWLGPHDAGRSGQLASARSRGSPVHGDPSESALGLGFHLRRDLGWLRLCGLRHRCLRPADRGLARLGVAAHRLRARALEQAIYDRGRDAAPALVYHSDRGTQYLSMAYTHRLADAGIAPSVGSRGDSYDNALAESVIGLFKVEVIRRKGPWRSLEAVEFATLDWVDWFNHRRLLEPIGYVPPAEYEAQYYEQAAVA
jgi:transposase InsO family protein